MNLCGRLFGGLLVSIVFFVTVVRGDQPPDRSPEAVFKASQAALQKNDIKAFMACLTAESQTLLTGQLAFGALMLKGVAALDRTGKAAEKVKPINAVFNRHGLTEAKINKLNLSRDPKDRRKSLHTIGGMVTDQPAFASELVAALAKANAPKVAKAPTGGRMTDLKIAGDNATGTFLSSKDGKETKTPIVFARVRGRWKIVLPEPNQTPTTKSTPSGKTLPESPLH